MIKTINKNRENEVKKIKKRRKFRHLTQLDRDRIQAMLDSGIKQEEIAKVLDFDAGAISREVNKRKTKDGRYIASVAQHKVCVKRGNSKSQGMKIEKHPEIRDCIIQEMTGKFHRSPDEIAGWIKRQGWPVTISTKAIYRWLYSRWGQQYCRYLCTKRYKKKHHKNKTKREMIPNRIPIHLRPAEGVHVEGDLFVSPTRSGTQRSGILIVIPETKLFVGKMIENKKPATMRLAVKEKIDNLAVDDMTLDNGIENREHEQFGLPTYFCDPHSPWQKPNVEGGIGLVRRWFIKKNTDLRDVSEEQYQDHLHVLNSKYRKSLGYKSAYEVSIERGIIKSNFFQSKTPIMGDVIIQSKSCISV